MDIHIAPGPTAAESMRMALGFGRDSLFVHQDVLSCGPLSANVTPAEFGSMRALYWKGIHANKECEERSDFPDILGNLEAIRQADQVVAWAGSGTADQLFLACLVGMFRNIGAGVGCLRIVQFGRDSARGNAITSLGILNPAQFLTHPPMHALTGGEADELDFAWRSVCSPDPRDLLEFLAGSSTGNPWLRKAISGLLRRYPDANSGLNACEVDLLRNVRDHGDHLHYVIGATMVDAMESPDWVGEPYLRARLRRLADPNLPAPFLRLAGGRGEVTEAGRKALRGEANFAAINGIDDWIGGVHLESAKSRVWWRSGNQLIQA